MRGFILIFSSVLAENTLSKEKANTFLRKRRENEGRRFEMFERGNLERECFEESCNSLEFHEVYDDVKVSEPLYVSKSIENLSKIIIFRQNMFFANMMLSTRIFRPLIL